MGKRVVSDPVQVRSIATRRALLDAAIESLCADGYAAVTTADIARRAGVSRGAQQHHFPSKAALLSAAVEHVLEVRLQEFAALLDESPALEQIDRAVDLLWEMFQGPAFIAWLELWMAARTDADLAAVMADVDRRFTSASRQMVVEQLTIEQGMDPTTVELVRDFAIAVMEGMALQRLVPRGQRPASEYLDVLKRVIPSLLAELDSSTAP